MADAAPTGGAPTGGAPTGAAPVDDVVEEARRVDDDALDEADVLAAAVAPTPRIESDAPAIVARARELVAGAADDTDAVRRVYEWVRDGIAYGMAPGHRTLPAATEVLARDRATCIPKATLLTALLRSLAVPTLVSFYDVRDHQIGRRLQEMLGTNTYPWHAVPRIRIGDRWVRLEVSIDHALAERQGWRKVEFSAVADQMMAPTTVDGRPHWEVLADHGTWTGIPSEQIRAGLQRMYGDRTAPGEAATRTAERG